MRSMHGLDGISRYYPLMVILAVVSSTLLIACIPNQPDSPKDLLNVIKEPLRPRMMISGVSMVNPLSQRHGTTPLCSLSSHLLYSHTLILRCISMSPLLKSNIIEALCLCSDTAGDTTKTSSAALTLTGDVCLVKPLESSRLGLSSPMRLKIVELHQETATLGNVLLVLVNA